MIDNMMMTKDKGWWYKYQWNDNNDDTNLINKG